MRVTLPWLVLAGCNAVTHQQHGWDAGCAEATQEAADQGALDGAACEPPVRSPPWPLLGDLGLALRFRSEAWQAGYRDGWDACYLAPYHEAYDDAGAACDTGSW